MTSMILKGDSMQRKGLISIALTAALLVPVSIQAQGTLYVSNLDHTPTGNTPIGSDSWLAQVFRTGTQSQGYLLNAVQLRMDASSGTPSGFEVFIYGSSALEPAENLGGLIGPDPAAGGVFAFSGSAIPLSPSSYYFVVVTAATPIEQGAYTWSMTSTSPTVSGWDIPNIGRYRSIDGSDWTFEGRLDVFQMAIYATPVPEPTTASLMGLSLLAILRFRRSS